jgi:hypothetical protein
MDLTVHEHIQCTGEQAGQQHMQKYETRRHAQLETPVYQNNATLICCTHKILLNMLVKLQRYAVYFKETPSKFPLPPGEGKCRINWRFLKWFIQLLHG